MALVVWVGQMGGKKGGAKTIRKLTTESRGNICTQHNMPQFDICSFSIQVFWLFVFLSIFYSILTCYILPTTLNIIKFRNKNTQEELLSSEVF